MPLSDNEQRLLEQMERALYAEDPKFASAMRGAARARGTWMRLAIGLVAVLAGLSALIFFGVANGSLVAGVLGFLLMLAGTVYALSGRRRLPGPAGVVTPEGTVRQGQRPRSRAKGGSTFMQRLEQRWDRRRDER